MGTIPVASPTPPRKLRFSRRAVIVGVALLSVAALAAVAVIFAWPEGAPRPALVVAGRVDQFDPATVTYFGDDHLFLVRLPDGKFLALSDSAQHLDREMVEWRPDFVFHGMRGWFRSRFHGETFAIDGTIVFGPASRSMDRYKVLIQGDLVKVDTRQLYCGPTTVLPGSSCDLSPDASPVAAPQ